MPKYIKTLCNGCGKLFNKVLALRDNFIDTDNTCWTCQQTLSAMNAKNLAKKLELPALTGTDKQLNWGEPVRIKIVNELLVRLQDYWDEGLQFKTAKKILLHILARPNFVRASFWIEHRNNEYGLKNYILKLATEELKKSNHLQLMSSSI